MSDDLHRALTERGNAFRPDRIPPFQGLRDRKRRRDQRRAGAAVALSVAAVLGIAVVPSALGSGGGGGSTPDLADQAQSSVEYRYRINWPANTQDYSDAVYRALTEQCLTLPGLSEGSVEESRPPGLSGRITGAGNADAFRECAQEAAPGAKVEVLEDLSEESTPTNLAFQITWDTDAYDGANDDARLKTCLDLPEVSSPADPFFTRPPSYNVTVTGAEQVAAFRACLADLDGLVVKERPVATGGPDERTYTLLPGSRTVGNSRVEEQRAACLALPGIASAVQLQSDPVQYRVVVVGGQENKDFRDCIRKVAGLYVPELAPQLADTQTAPLSEAQQAFIESCVGAENALPAPGLVGKRLSRILLDASVRTVGLDGECLGRARDRQEDRINIIVDNDVITWAGRFQVVR